MNIALEVIPADVWSKDYSEAIHSLIFQYNRPGKWDRIDYALLFSDVESDEIVAYVTIREFDERTAYMQFGGVMPKYKNGLWAYRCYEKAMTFLKEKYKYINTKIENTNKVMLKFASKQGFLIVGASQLLGATMLDHLIDMEAV